LIAALLACKQDPDVGQPCGMSLTDAAGNPIDVPTGQEGQYCSLVGADYFRTGATECDNLVCIRSATGVCATNSQMVNVRRYCSKACVSDDECFKSQTGLVCRAVVLDAAFLASLPPDVRQLYLGDVQSSNYCATPPP
jgi:hypothetical protein